MEPTTETRRELKLSVKESLSLMKQLADEIRVDLHLGTMEAKQRWQDQLEPSIQRAELAVEKANKSAQRAVEDAVSAFKEFKSSLKAAAQK